MRRVEPRGWAIVLGTAAVLVFILGAGLLGLRGGATPTAGTSPGSTPAAGARTAFVARISAHDAAIAWSPEGAHLLLTDDSGSRVYDRTGKLVAEFGNRQGWLDETHLVRSDGVVSVIGAGPMASPAATGWNGPVVAGGHGAAALIVAQPACVGDPIVDWYRDGKYVKTGQKVTPFGWSADGKLALMGHLDCSSEDAELHGWKGPVDVVDFATGKVLATAPAVRGEMAFSPDGGDLAAQSDSDLEIVEIDTGEVTTLPGLRFLGWLDTESLYALSGTQVQFVDLDPTGVSPATDNLWQAESPTGLHIRADVTGAVRAVVASDGTALLDLSSAGLIAERYGDPTGFVGTYLQPQWWSPDGGMLALNSADGRSVVMLSIDPTKAGTYTE